MGLRGLCLGWYPGSGGEELLECVEEVDAVFVGCLEVGADRDKCLEVIV